MRINKSYLILLLVGVFISCTIQAQKIDTIYFQHGDRVTGEVKSLDNNQLRLSTNDAGTISVEWNKVDSVKIVNNMRIVLNQGGILYGKLLGAGEAGKCIIWNRIGDPIQLDLIRIVSLSQLEEKILDRINGTLSSGFSYVKASQVMQLNFHGSIEYQAEKNYFQLYYDGIFTNDPQSGSTQRQDGGLTFMRIFPKNWFLVSSLTAESNSELGLDMRTSLSLGGGNSIINTNFTRLYAALGMQGNRENSAETDQFNVEGLLVTNYSVFIYDDPEVSFNFSANLLPSLTTLGRVRANFDSSLKWEIFNDFYLKWTFYYNYDNQPLTETAEKKDWAVTLIGVEFRL